MTNYGIIYKFTCKITGKSYVGQTTKNRLKTRINRHKTCNLNLHFYNARDKYGWDNFEFSIIEDHISLDEKDLLNNREIYWIEYYDSFRNGYNSTKGGDGGNTYEKKSEDELLKIKKKLSEASKGDKNAMSKKVKIINIITSEEKIFDTITSAADFFKVHRRSVGRWINSEKIFNNWRIILLDKD